MASPFPWSTATPGDTDVVSVFPALARARQSTLGAASASGGVLGTLVPTAGAGTATVGWRVNQDFDSAFVTMNAWYSGTAWTFDNIAKVAWREDLDVVNDYIRWLRAPASANPPVFTEWMRLTNSGVLQPGADNTGSVGVGATRWANAAFAGYVALGAAPISGTGAIRLPYNLAGLYFRNQANNADINGWTFGDGSNANMIHTNASEIYPDTDNACALGESAQRFSTAFIAQNLSLGASPFAAGGAIRLANNLSISWRTFGNTGDVGILAIGSSPTNLQFTLDGVGGAVVPNSDAAYDVGTGGLRWRNSNLSGFIAIGTNPSGTGLVRLPYAGGGLYFRNQANNADYQAIDFVTIGATNVLAVGTSSSLQGVALGVGNVATNATNGFPYMASNAGAPTGVPVTVTGFVPMYYDTTNHKIWFYDSGWKGVVVA